MKRFYEICRARFRRWLYLLFIGMWRGEVAFEHKEYLNGKCRIVGISSGTIEMKSWRVWWRDPDNSIMELQDWGVSP
jgi:hypothetical protein